MPLANRSKIMCHLYISIPVSYTHLDVYKRQVHKCTSAVQHPENVQAYDGRRSVHSQVPVFFYNVPDKPGGEEELTLSHIDMDVINFVQRMFWASGWYAKLEGKMCIRDSYCCINVR